MPLVGRQNNRLQSSKDKLVIVWYIMADLPWAMDRIYNDSLEFCVLEPRDREKDSQPPL